jgi:uncharacterized iron-regulated membrane protein
MKFSPRTFKIQWDLHAWSGVIASVFLFVIFYCGVFALFHTELVTWQEPRAAPGATVPGLSFETVLARAERVVSIPTGAYVSISQEPDSSITSVSISHEASKFEKDLSFDRQSGTKRAPTSRLADELYLMHFFYRLPGGIEFAGFLALALFVATVSGLVIHWKQLVRQIWQFRPTLRLRFSASDAHKVLGLFGLPFAVIFAWSGALLGLWAIVAAPFVYGVHAGDRTAFDKQQGYGEVQRALKGAAAPRLSLDKLAARADIELRTHYGAALPNPQPRPSRIDIQLYGDAHAWANFRLNRSGFEAQKSVALSLTTGEALNFGGERTAPAEVVDRILFDLHYALFGGYLVKFLYAFLALAVCAVAVTGNLVWLERRDATRSSVGNRLLERLTVGVTLGVVFASSCYFLQNRLLPTGFPYRADLEFVVFLGIWALVVVAACVPGWRPWRVAHALSGAASACFGGTLVLDLARGQVRLGAQPADVHVVAVEALLLLLAVATFALKRGLRDRSVRALPKEGGGDVPEVTAAQPDDFDVAAMSPPR